MFFSLNLIFFPLQLWEARGYSLKFWHFNHHDMIQETSQSMQDLVSSDQHLYNSNYNSNGVDDISPHQRGNNGLSIHYNPREMAVAFFMSQKIKVLTNDTTSSQSCPGSSSCSQFYFTPICSRLLSGSSIWVMK